MGGATAIIPWVSEVPVGVSESIGKVISAVSTNWRTGVATWHTSTVATLDTP